MKKIYHIEAIVTIIGTVVGLGIFAIPYAARNVGVWPTAFLTIAIGFIMVLLNILFAEIILFNKKSECIIGYAKEHLGEWAGKIETFSIVFGYGGSMVAYLLAGTIFLEGLLYKNGDHFWQIVLIYTAVNSLVFARGIKSLGSLETFLTGIMLLVFVLIFFKSFPHWGYSYGEWNETLVPYGVVWFALTGASAIPVSLKILKGQEKKILDVILISYFLIILVTILFFAAVIKVCDGGIVQDPFVSLGKTMGDWVIYVGSLLGILAVITSQWPVGTYLKEIFVEDLKIPLVISWALVVLGPLTLLLLGVSNFVKVISLIGVVAGTIDALMILTIYSKIFSKKRTKPKILPFKVPVWVTWAVFIMIVGAAVVSIMS